MLWSQVCTAEGDIREGNSLLVDASSLMHGADGAPAPTLKFFWYRSEHRVADAAVADLAVSLADVRLSSLAAPGSPTVANETPRGGLSGAPLRIVSHSGRSQSV